jgi:3-methyladenine DNA glycosylase/8-oxoguanine DNA glycosylase
LQHVVRDGDDVGVTCWGPGAEWLIEQAPRLFGSADDVSGFDPGPLPVVAAAHRRRTWLRLGRTDQVLESLAPASIEQVVTGKEAFAAQRILARRFGDRLGGPALDEAHPAWGMRLPLSAEQWLAVPSWEFLRAGVEARRTRALLAGARAGRSLERLASDAYIGDADAALRSLPGVGPWTSANVRQRALGDADAWSIGDYHVGGLIGFALVGEKLDDDAVEELLEPYRGHRYRVEVLLLGSPGPRPERHGPRRSLPTHLPS